METQCMEVTECMDHTWVFMAATDRAMDLSETLQVMEATELMGQAMAVMDATMVVMEVSGVI